MAYKPTVSRKVISMHTESAIRCAWDDCEKYGYELHKIRVNYGTNHEPQVTSYVFCSERHKMFWATSHKHYGRLPPGYRMSTI